MGMLLSLPMIAAGVAFVLWAIRRPRNSEAVR
jgi:prolipoprotein diacylglyceryltransferase